MLDPRIYRTGLVAVALAVIVVAFSLQDPPGAATSPLAPDAFNPQNAWTKINGLAATNPNRRPGSVGDEAVATSVANSFKSYGWSVSRSTFTGRTVDGTKTLENVTATRTGPPGGAIVVVAHRDSLGSPAATELSGTAVLIELARILAGETLHHTFVLASTSGSAGAAGGTELARSLGTQVQSVVVLGDLAGTRASQPILVPWSNGAQVAPQLLRNTIAAALSAQAGLRAGGTGLGGQFARLALPLTISDQGPFGRLGDPAVTISTSGERGPAAAETPDRTQLTAIGRAVLSAINALDLVQSVPAPSAYLLFDGKLIPPWAIKLLVLALILPVLGATIDAIARTRRHGHRLVPAIVWVCSCVVPFLLGFGVVLLARVTGLLSATPPAPVPAGAVPLHAGELALLIALALIVVGAFAALRRWVVSEPAGPAAPSGLLLAMCALTIAVWVFNPFAAGLIVVALHLWMWLMVADLRLHPVAAVLLLLAGLAPAVLVIVYYANTLGLGPLQALWTAVLMVAGGAVGPLAVLAWSALLGCAVCAVVLALRATRDRQAEQQPITVRGPITYAGPGSLGGTESALRR
jgi:hypothetical protein